MNSDSTLVYILVAISALHFLVGLGYLMYKLGRPSKSKKRDAED